MTDELTRLKNALAKPPGPDPEARAAALRLAMKNFDQLQETAAIARPTPATPRRSGVWTGVRDMLASLSSRSILAATTSAAALGLGLVIFLPDLGKLPEATLPVATEKVAPLATTGPDSTVALEAPVAPAPAVLGKLADQGEARSDDMAASGAAMSVAPELAEAELAIAATDSLEAARSVVPAEPMAAAPVEADTEAFANADPGGVKVTAETPVSTFSIDVDTASYAIVRSSLMAGALPPREAVRIEEMVNYFPYAYPAPEAGGAPFRPDIAIMPTPWNPGTQLVRIGLQGRMPAIALRPPLNLVFLIDTSGSMQDANKLPLLKQGFRLMLGQLRPEDQVAIVAYAGSAGEVLAPTRAAERDTILSALDRLEAGGSTGGEEGLRLAYQVAQGMAADGRVGRVLLATDGDFNLGLSDPAALEDFIAGKRETGVYLSVLGFGRGNLDDATMQALAQAGNGQAAYIDTAQEARKVLVDQLTGAMFPIADDVKIQVEWNPAAVAEWRLIGYETRALNREDFSNDRIDAGEIGAGHSVTALYEITPPGSPALRNEPLRYGALPFEGDVAEVGFLRLRWKAPGDEASSLIEVPIRPGEGASDVEAGFAAAIAGFGQLLAGSTYLGGWGWEDAVALAEASRGEDPYGYRSEAISLMRLAQSLSPQ